MLRRLAAAAGCTYSGIDANSRNLLQRVVTGSRGNCNHDIAELRMKRRALRRRISLDNSFLTEYILAA